MNIFRRKLEINVKKELVRKKVKFKNFKIFIIVVIKIDDD